MTRPDYGIDAPGVVRNLFLIGTIGISAWALTLLVATFGQFAIPKPILVMTGMGMTTGIGCSLMGAWMLWHSKVGKLRNRERLLDRIVWSGDEQVLDVGCGRGLIMIGAAKRLTTGSATGIDIWQAQDLTRNGPEAVLENARLEQVTERVAVQTADVRKLPFGDSSFHGDHLRLPATRNTDCSKKPGPAGSSYGVPLFVNEFGFMPSAPPAPQSETSCCPLNIQL